MLVVIDLTEKTDNIEKDLAFIKEEPDKDKILIFVLNKKDLVSKEELLAKLADYKKLWGNNIQTIPVSAKLGVGIDELESILVSSSVSQPVSDQQVVVTNVRHLEALKPSLEAIKRVHSGLNSKIPGDLLAQDIREVLHYLGEITGEISTDEVLGNIFKNFCIGK